LEQLSIGWSGSAISLDSSFRLTSDAVAALPAGVPGVRAQTNISAFPSQISGVIPSKMCKTTHRLARTHRNLELTIRMSLIGSREKSLTTETVAPGIARFPRCFVLSDRWRGVYEHEHDDWKPYGSIPCCGTHLLSALTETRSQLCKHRSNESER
jgi:hypothetical protein